MLCFVAQQTTQIGNSSSQLCRVRHSDVNSCYIIAAAIMITGTATPLLPGYNIPEALAGAATCFANRCSVAVQMAILCSKGAGMSVDFKTKCSYRQFLSKVPIGFD